MIKVKDLAIELSIKLGDPRKDNGDGTLFFSEDRLKYIQRGYGKLLRTLSMAMRKYKPNFVMQLEPVNASGEKIVGKVSPFNIGPVIFVEEVIVTRKDGTEAKQSVASKLNQTNYNQVKFNLDDNHKASPTNVYYTFMNGVLYLLPDDKKYTAIDAMCVLDLQTLTQDGEIPIDKTYSDMLVTFAAIEAMNDLPNPQKVGLYRQELIDHVSVIANYTNLMERREGEKGNA